MGRAHGRALRRRRRRRRALLTLAPAAFGPGHDGGIKIDSIPMQQKQARPGRLETILSTLT